MRSLGSTVVLGLAAAFLCLLAAWQWREGNFDTLLGKPPTAVGQRLHDSFVQGDVKHIRVSAGGVSASFALRENGWRASTPWDDRMDPRAALAIINFTLGMRVEDVASADEVDSAAAGLGDGAVRIRLEGADRRPLANYKLGRASSWKAEVDGVEGPVETVFVQPRERHDKRHVYICTGDINPLFRDGLKFLRDHRPFYFNPVNLQKIRIRSQQGDLTLGRETPESPWRIVKPLDLPTDPAAMKKLLEGLYELQAVRVTDRTAAAPPAGDGAAKPAQIAISPFGSEAETVLDILPQETPEAHEVCATVSDRPTALFDLPLKPEPGLVTLADLPLAMNDLRDPTLTRLNIASLGAISIQPATGPEILISREPPKPWMTVIDGVTREASEENLFALLKAVTSSRAIGFESDAATDFTPWGLDRPILTLRFLSHDNQALELRFGMDTRGGLFVNRLGTPTVMRMDPALLSSISVRPYEWRHARLWSVDRVNLLAIKRSENGGSPLVLKYRFNQEAWEATRDGVDLTAALDPARANYLLSVLEGLKVSRWLAEGDEKALAALGKPSLGLVVTELTVDAEGETTGVMDRAVSFAPADKPGYYFGSLDKDPHPFLIDAATYGKLGMELLDPSITRQAMAAKEADVIVYGSTPGGFCAAIAASREGASVILLEPSGHVGGLSTGGLSFSDSNQTVRDTVMGLFHEWHTRIEQDYASRGIKLPYQVSVKDQAKWTYEPHVAARVTRRMLEEAKVEVFTKHRLRSVRKEGDRITGLVAGDGVYGAKVFVDATYEGDLMAAAGVGWTIGREGRAEYGESLAGKQYPKKKMDISGVDADGRLLPLVTTDDAGPEKEGDSNVMTYSFRLCLTEDPDNRVPIPQPANYDPARFEIVRRFVKAGGEPRIDLYPLPGGKLDGNNSIGGQFSIGWIGGGNGWCEADEAGRAAIWEAHKQYTLEFYHFLTTDPAVPERIRGKYARLGFCRDEFAEYGHFPPALYVREGRRMKGMYVLSQKDILEDPRKEDPIVISSFPIDSHDCQRVALKGGGVINEGTIFPVRRDNPKQGYPYQVPYRAILPKPDECGNLLVPVALSCTHVALSSIRVEPTWMILGQSAGIAAALSAKQNVSVQELAYPTLRERLLAQNQVLDLPGQPAPPTEN